MARNGMFSRRTRSPLSQSDEFGDVHVLAVDDSLIDRKVIERLLKITSCKVTAVESGPRALQYLGLDQEKTSPDFVHVDMIITDYCMPEMTGYELLKKVKGSANFREVPVVIMSSENVVARIDRCLEEGAEDFIVKPVKLSDVKRLKDYMFGPATANTILDNHTFDNINNNKQEKGSFNKRKLQQMCDTPPSTSPSPPNTSPSPPTSATPSPPTTSPSPPASPTPSTPRVSCSTSPFSPSELESPTMRLKVTSTDQD